MAKSEKKSAKKANAVATDESIALQTAEFLKSGGKIQQIPTGISGQSNMSGPKHITLVNKATTEKATTEKATTEKTTTEKTTAEASEPAKTVSEK